MHFWGLRRPQCRVREQHHRTSGVEGALPLQFLPVAFWPTFLRGPTFAFLRVLGPSCPSQDAKRVRRLCVSVEDLSFTHRGSGGRQVALGLGSEQSQASPKQRTQRSQAEHQRASPAPRRRKKRVASSRRKPGGGDPTKHSKEPLSRRRRR